MTAYGIIAINQNLVITAGAYEIRLAGINMWANSNTAYWMPIYRYDGASASGGSVGDCVPLRSGAPAASAVARLGSGAPSGTSNLLFEGYLGTTGTATGVSSQFNPPLTVTIGVGSALYVPVPSTIDHVVNVYFEELRLQGSF